MAKPTKRSIQTVPALRQQAPEGPWRVAFVVAVAVAAAVLFAGGAARAATYKWVDEKGVVHYTDKMPPEAVDKANVELNKSGVPINRTDRAMTPEQRRANELEAERAKEAARAQEEIARRDRALVASYTSEAEIDLARNRSLQTITNVILSSQAFSDQLAKRKADVETKRTESQGKPIASVLDRELESIDAELTRQNDLIAQKKRESATITAKYDADKQRWRELVAAKSSTKPASKSAGSAVAPVAGTPKK